MMIESNPCFLNLAIEVSNKINTQKVQVQKIELFLCKNMIKKYLHLYQLPIQYTISATDISVDDKC